MPIRGLHVEDVTGLDPFTKMAGSDARFDLRLTRYGTNLFDRHSVVVLADRAVGKRIAANDRFAFAGNVELKSQILAGFEGRQRAAIMRGQIKGLHAIAFGDFFHDLELAIAAP